MRDRPIIVSCVGAYLPGFLGGGPVRSIANLVDALGDAYEFRVIAADHDLGSSAPYSGITYGRWNQVGKAAVWYLPHGIQGRIEYRRLLTAFQYEVLYLNGFFGKYTVYPLALRRARLIPKTPTVIAPRGEFDPGALHLKPLKKNAFLNFWLRAGFCDRVTWHAASQLERTHINCLLARFGRSRATIRIAANIVNDIREAETFRHKRIGPAKFVFASRIVPKKNLLFLLKAFRSVAAPCSLDVIGPIEDDAYWNECSAIVAQLPSHVRFRYCGAMAHGELQGALTSYDYFVLPTMGENFGHIIAEALRAGLPVLLSDRTPWSRLGETGAGWNLSIADHSKWTEAIDQCIQISADAYLNLRHRARAMWLESLADADAIAAHDRLFKAVIDGHKLMAVDKVETEMAAH